MEGSDVGTKRWVDVLHATAAARPGVLRHAFGRAEVNAVTKLRIAGLVCRRFRQDAGVCQLCNGTVCAHRTKGAGQTGITSVMPPCIVEIVALGMFSTFSRYVTELLLHSITGKNKNTENTTSTSMPSTRDFGILHEFGARLTANEHGHDFSVSGLRCSRGSPLTCATLG